MNKISIFFGLALLAVGNADAASITIGMPGITGTYTAVPWTLRSDFIDLHAQFLSIDTITISVLGHGEAGSIEFCDVGIPPQNCTPITWPAVATFYFDSEPGLAYAGAIGAFGPSLLTYTLVIDHVLLGSGPSLDFLLDGIGEITIEPNVIGCGGCTFGDAVPPWFEILKLTLTVDGVLVPIPAAIWLMLSALAGLFGMSKRGQSKRGQTTVSEKGDRPRFDQTGSKSKRGQTTV